VSLVELLNEIGARNAIGRVDLVENRLSELNHADAMKRGELCSSPPIAS